MQPKMNPTMALAQAKLYWNQNRGSIREAIEAGGVQRDEFVNSYIQEKMDEEQNKLENAEDQARMDSFMQKAKDRVDARRGQLQELSNAGAGSSAEEDLLATLGTTGGT